MHTKIKGGNKNGKTKKSTIPEENEKITPDEYKNWVVYGGEIKDKTEKGEISYSEFEEIMNYNIEDTKRWIKTIKEGKEGE